MGKMCQLLDAIWQQSQDKRSPLQQSDVKEARENGSRKRSRSGSPPMSDSSNEDENPDVRKSGKSRKTDLTTGRGKSEVEDDRMSVHVNDTPDNISELIQDDAEESDTGSPDETLKGLGEKVEEIEPTGADVKQKFAEIDEKRWNKKLSFARLNLFRIHIPDPPIAQQSVQCR